jgi:hypothetical protein
MLRNLYFPYWCFEEVLDSFGIFKEGKRSTVTNYRVSKMDERKPKIILWRGGWVGISIDLYILLHPHEIPTILRIMHEG